MCSMPAFVGAVLLFIDGFLWIVDNYAHAASEECPSFVLIFLEGQQHIYGGGVGRPGTLRWRLEGFPWFFCSVIFFFLGTCGDIAGETNALRCHAFSF